jgi:hypothetical protein
MRPRPARTRREQIIVAIGAALMLAAGALAAIIAAGDDSGSRARDLLTPALAVVGAIAIVNFVLILVLNARLRKFTSLYGAASRAGTEGRLEAAAALYARAARFARFVADQRLCEASAALFSGRPDDARVPFKALSRHELVKPAVRAWAALCLAFSDLLSERPELVEEALASATTARESNGDSTSGMQVYAWALVASGDLAAGTALLEQLATLPTDDSTRSDVEYTLAIAYAVAARWDDARTALARGDSGPGSLVRPVAHGRVNGGTP